MRRKVLYKKFSLLCLIILLLFGLIGCNSNSSSDVDSEENYTQENNVTNSNKIDNGELILDLSKADLQSLQPGTFIKEYEYELASGVNTQLQIFKPVLLESTIEALEDAGFTYVAIVQTGCLSDENDVTNWLLYLPKETSLPVQIRTAPSESLIESFRTVPDKFTAETEEEITVAGRVYRSSDHNFNDDLTSTVMTEHEVESQASDIDYITNYIE